MADKQATRPNGDPITGLFYREHPTRRHGLHPDRYYFLKFWHGGRKRTLTEGQGWASEGTRPTDCQKRLLEIKVEIRKGAYLTPAERREKEAFELQEKAAAKKEKAAEALTFGDVFEQNYLPHSKETKRNERSWQREEALYRLWIKPVIGEKPLRAVAPFDLERIRRDMEKAGRSARSIHYAYQTVGGVFRFAIRNRLYRGDVPTVGAKRPSYDNQRKRYLSREEAEALLAELFKRSKNLHDMALLSLNAGLRAGEIFSLRWSHVDLENARLNLFDTKNGKSRTVFLNQRAVAMFKTRPEGKPDSLIFPSRNGGQAVQVSDSFNRAVDKLKLNEGITDRRQRITFHCLRHSFASHLVSDGVDLFTIKELLGHSDYKMAARYSHVAPRSLQAAVARLDAAPEAPGAEVLPAEGKDKGAA